MADTSLFGRLRRLFSTDVIIRNIGGNQLKIADINLSFRKMLEEQGFDSIKYFNAADTPATEETTDAFSYILFKPEQFKLLNAVEFDDKDPRPNFEQGGKVLKVLNKRKAA